MKLKFVFALAIAAALTVGCKQTDAQETTTKEVAVAGKTETASFTIEGMSCAVGCANTLQKKLAATEGVKKATVDFEAKLATVDYDSAVTSPEKLAQIVEKAAGGDTYKVANMKSTADKAMLNNTEKDKKKKKKSKKNSKEETAPKAGCDDKAPTSKPGCCAAKKSCAA